MVKSTGWMTVLVVSVVWGLLSAQARGQADESEVLSMLERQVENRERALEMVRQQFEAGLDKASSVFTAEEQLLESQLALVREREGREEGPLERPIPSIELGASNLEEVSGILRDLLDGKVNFVLKEGAADLAVPALNLRGTDLLTLLNILSDIVPDLGVKVTADSRVVPIHPFPAPMPSGGSSGMQEDPFDPFGVGFASPIDLSEHATVIFERTHREPPESRSTLTLFIGELMDEMELDDICMSIQTAWDLNRGPIEPILRFHEDTDLLIVAGDPGHIRTAEEVIAQLGQRRTLIRNQAREDLQMRYRKIEDDLKTQYANREEKLAAEVENQREEMEGELRLVREHAIAERRQLLDEMEELKQMLTGERERRLDLSEAEEDPDS